MKRVLMKIFLSGVGLICLVAFGTIWPGVSADAQTFSILKQFGILTNMTGFNPYSQLVQGPDGALYGTTYGGEASFMHGTVFKVQPDGSGFTTLHWFTNGASQGYPYGGLVVHGSTLFGTASGSTEDVGNLGGAVFSLKIDGSDYKILKDFSTSHQVDGSTPMAKLVVSGDELYGTTEYGGLFKSGTVFRLKIDGSGFNVLKNFSQTNSDGAGPHGALVLSHKILYGTTAYGGPFGHGTAFKMNVNGSAYTVLHSFNTDEGAPQSELTLSGTNLYGTTLGYGTNPGTVYKLSTDGSGFTVLKRLTSTDGSYPYAGLTLLSNRLFGTTYRGGISNYGTIFRINTDGSGFVVLKDFLGSDGANPYSSMSSIGGVLYGATSDGGLGVFAGLGTLFKINPDGTDYALIKQFTYSDGRFPSPLIQSGDTLFGTTDRGGNWGRGIVFRINTDGSDYQIIQHISPSNGVPQGPLALSAGVLYGASSGEFTGFGTVFKLSTNGIGFSTLKQFTNAAVEGDELLGGVTVSDSTIYGRTAYGGPSYYGTLFKMSTNGSDYTVLKSFSQTDGSYNGGTLTVSGNVIYATTPEGGSGSSGTIFSINTDGAGYRLLKEFSPTASPWWTNSDGARPQSELVLAGNVLYGATSRGGITGYGTAYRINTDGTGFTVLRQLTGYNDLPIGGFTVSDDLIYGSGSGNVFQMKTDGTGYSILKQFDGYISPSGPPVVSGSLLYGTTSQGGIWNYGLVFAIDTSGPLLPIPLNSRRLGESLVLDWHHAAFSLQAAPELNGTYTNVPGATSPYTNPIAGSGTFFRLIGHRGRLR